MYARFRQTTAGLQCSLVETRRIDGNIRHEHVASLGSVPASPSFADRIAFWRRVYQQLAQLANRIDAETQGKIISAVHSRIPMVTPDEQRALRARPRSRGRQKAPRDGAVDERPRGEAELAKIAEHAERAKERIMRAERSENIEGSLGKPITAEELQGHPRSLTSLHSIPLRSGKSHFTEEQIIGILKKYKAGAGVSSRVRQSRYDQARHQ